MVLEKELRFKWKIQLLRCFVLPRTGYNLLSGTWGVHNHYTCLQASCPAFSSLMLTLVVISLMLTLVVIFLGFAHLIYHHFVVGKGCHMALEMLGIAGPPSVVLSPSFLYERMRQEMSGEGTLWVRYLSIALDS